MSTVRRIAANAAVSSIAQFANYVLAFFYMLYAARYLGTASFGLLSFALAFAAIFGLIADLGLRTLTVREVARDRSLAHKFTANVLVMKLGLAVIGYGLMALIVNLMPHSEETLVVVYIIGLSVVLSAFTQVFYSVFQAFEKMEYVSLGLVLNGALMLIGVVVAMQLGLGLIGFALLFLLARAVELVYGMVAYRLKFQNGATRQPGGLGLDLAFWKQSLKEAWPMGAMAIGILIYFRIDTVMLSFMKDDVAVGLYSAAYRLSELSAVIPGMFVAAIFPVMSQYYRAAGNSFAMAYEKSSRYLFMLALPIALAVTLLASPIVNLVYGSQYADSASALQVLIWAAAIMYVTMVMGTTFVAANKQMVNLKIVIVAAALNIVLNVFLIPRYSYVGASAATVATEAFGLLCGVFFLRRAGYGVSIKNVYLLPLLALCAAIAISAVLLIIGVNAFVAAPVGVVVYAVIVFTTMIRDDDRQLMRKVLGLRKLKVWKRGDP